MLDITHGPAVRHQALTIFPLFSRTETRLPYILLNDALHAGVVRITEVDGSTVPQLLAANRGDDDVLILDGEQLVGARQNRTTSRSLILGGRTETKIPVSCMEQGRWHHVSPEFEPSLYNSPARVRRHARRAEATNVAEGRPAAPESLSEAQGSVWAEIADASETLGVHSKSGALDEAYRARESDLAGWAASFPAAEGQVGVLAFLGGEPVGMDLIGDAAIYAEVHNRLLMGYAMDGLSGGAAGAGGEDADGFLKAVQAAARTASPTVGLGSYRVLSGTVVGGELADRERLVHLSAFPSLDRPFRAPRPPQPPLYRRRRTE